MVADIGNTGADGTITSEWQIKWRGTADWTACGACAGGTKGGGGAVSKLSCQEWGLRL